MVLTETAQLVLTSLRDNPADVANMAAAIDALQDAGVKPLTAKRLANQAAKAGALEKQMAKARAIVSGSTEARRTIRGAAGSNGTAVVIEVVPFDARPELLGEPAYHTFRGSNTVVNYPGAARRAGHKTDYHASTRRIVVGAKWVIQNCE